MSSEPNFRPRTHPVPSPRCRTGLSCSAVWSVSTRMGNREPGPMRTSKRAARPAATSTTPRVAARLRAGTVTWIQRCAATTGAAERSIPTQ